jgi:hypothetical protein
MARTQTRWCRPRAQRTLFVKEARNAMRRAFRGMQPRIALLQPRAPTQTHLHNRTAPRMLARALRTLSHALEHGQPFTDTRQTSHRPRTDLKHN